MTKKKQTLTEIDIDEKFFDRDLSWLSFNERLLIEAERDTVPLMERIKFLAIYSSNLDEFYRVRMSALMALRRLSNESEITKIAGVLPLVHKKILAQQKHFGSIIKNKILHVLRDHNINLLYSEPIPDIIKEHLTNYFIDVVASYIQIIDLQEQSRFFTENNKLYLLVTTIGPQQPKQFYIVNIPSDALPRFHEVSYGDIKYIVFLDDIIKLCLSKIFGKGLGIKSQSFKITKDAELDLGDEFSGNLARKIEKKISQRDLGFATRVLFEPGVSKNTLELMKTKFDLKGASFIQGGHYHNLKDFSTLPLRESKFNYEAWPRIKFNVRQDESLFQKIERRDIMLHPPYHDYDTILRFFNEASIDNTVKKIYVTLYRLASDSRIVTALINAAKNGKKVIVFVELKARFDEINNIKWSKRMRAAGIRIIESIPGLKVHAKLALVVRKSGKRTDALGLVATGNFNESTARYYTDHVLMTAYTPILEEIQSLFLFLKKRKKQSRKENQVFEHLLVGQFNLQERFLSLIDREIAQAKDGSAASIIIKFNNLEDKVLISKLYEASQAGVKISLIVRSICCLMPGVKGMSENITVSRIIDRYLEHGRVFIFNNANNPEVFIGSSDWMNRNIYSRIEVCVPIYDAKLKTELIDIIKLQLSDNCQAVLLDEQCNNVHISTDEPVGQIRSQFLIGSMLTASGGEA